MEFLEATTVRDGRSTLEGKAASARNDARTIKQQHDGGKISAPENEEKAVVPALHRSRGEHTSLGELILNPHRERLINPLGKMKRQI